MLDKVKQVLSVFENIEIIEKEGEIIIKEKNENLPDLINFLKIYVPEENIKQSGNLIEVDNTTLSANKMRVLLMSVFNEYDYEVVDSYKLLIKPKIKQFENKTEKEEVKENKVNEEINKDIKEDKENTEENIAKYVDEKYKESIIRLLPEHIEIVGEDLMKIAKDVDEKFKDVIIEIHDEKLLIKTK